MLAAWGEASGPVELRTRSGRILRVRHRLESRRYLTSLSGEARIVFFGEFGELSNTAG
jgi:hypothetical protein